MSVVSGDLVQKRKASEPPVDSTEAKRTKATRALALHIWETDVASKTMLPSPGSRLSENVRLFRHSDLLQLPHLPQEMDQLYGLDDMKASLLSAIRTPLAKPTLYSFAKSAFRASDADECSGGKMPLAHGLFYFGARGSGKQTLVRTFCAETGLTLLEAYAPGFNPQTELDGLFNSALQAFPSVILFNECEGYFRTGSPHCGQLWGWLEKLHAAQVPVWVVFCAQVKPDILDPSIQRLVKSAVWSGVLCKADLERVWTKAILQHMPQHQPIIPLQVGELAMLVRDSTDCVARNIFDFVSDVFLAKIAALGFEVDLHASDSIVFIPTARDFKLALIVHPMTGAQRITRGLPDEENILHYTNQFHKEHAIPDPYGSYQK